MAVQHLVIGDSRRLPEVADGSVHLVVTSPPYWQLKDYGSPGQIGWRQDYEAYLDDLDLVWKECARALAPGCRACVNIGDQFARKEVYGRYRVIPIHADLVRRIEAFGLDFHGSIIWQKVTTCNASGGGAVMGSYPFPRNGVVKLDYEHVLLFKKPGAAPPPSPEAKERAALTVEEWKTFFNGHWTFPGTRAHLHLAPFPVELPRRLIRMFTFEGERVLDPFAGSGTTLVAAHELGREGIGVDLDPAAERIVEERLAGDGGAALFDRPELRVTVRPAAPAGPAGEAPEEAASAAGAAPAPEFFGSVIAKADRGKRRFPGIRDRLDTVLGPNSFKTKAGRHVVLLGTRPRPGRLREAAEKLEEILDGRPFLLTGRQREDLPDGEEKAYVHLLDRTFVNSRLLRLGLLLADREDTDHASHAKFIRESQ